MGAGDMTGIFLAIQYELLLFAGVFFLVCALDELAVDLLYALRRLIRIGAGQSSVPDMYAPYRGGGGRPFLKGAAAVFVPAWQEAEVIGATLRHMSGVWAHHNLTIYVGCYPNDPATIAAARAAANADARIRVVVHERNGPTSKPDCLNHLWRTLRAQETASGVPTRMVVLHDAEDMVDPAAMGLLDRALVDCDFAQLPVIALPQTRSRWVGGHYSDEFAEAHGKTMVVRDWLRAGLPGAGVGTAIRCDMLRRATAPGERGPFEDNALTEDYQLGLRIAQMGGRQRFLRERAPDGRLIATRAYFPASLSAAVRQKTRWTHGIAFQGWDRIGWQGGLAARWMQARDRRGPLSAALIAIAYLLFVVTAFNFAALQWGMGLAVPFTPVLELLLMANLGFLAWRIAIRFVFTAREHGWREGVLAIARVPVSNVIHIMAGRRAALAYWRSLSGIAPTWDKTVHHHHPAMMQETKLAA